MDGNGGLKNRGMEPADVEDRRKAVSELTETEFDAISSFPFEPSVAKSNIENMIGVITIDSDGKTQWKEFVGVGDDHQLLIGGQGGGGVNGNVDAAVLPHGGAVRRGCADYRRKPWTGRQPNHGGNSLYRCRCHASRLPSFDRNG